MKRILLYAFLILGPQNGSEELESIFEGMNPRVSWDNNDQIDQMDLPRDIDASHERSRFHRGQIDQMTNYPFKRYYRVDEVAEYFSISVRTLYRLIQEGELSGVKIRGCLRISVTEIQRYEKELRKQMAGS